MTQGLSSSPCLFFSSSPSCLYLCLPSPYRLPLSCPSIAVPEGRKREASQSHQSDLIWVPLLAQRAAWRPRRGLLLAAPICHQLALCHSCNWTRCCIKIGWVILVCHAPQWETEAMEEQVLQPTRSSPPPLSDVFSRLGDCLFMLFINTVEKL